jgi:hypothetical protein
MQPTEEMTYRELVVSKLNAIQTQTTLTNGRVTALETELTAVKEWRAEVRGAFKVLYALLTLLILPLSFIIIQIIFK